MGACWWWRARHIGWLVRQASPFNEIIRVWSRIGNSKASIVDFCCAKERLWGKAYWWDCSFINEGSNLRSWRGSLFAWWERNHSWRRWLVSNWVKIIHHWNGRRMWHSFLYHITQYALDSRLKIFSREFVYYFFLLFATINFLSMKTANNFSLPSVKRLLVIAKKTIYAKNPLLSTTLARVNKYFFPLHIGRFAIFFLSSLFYFLWLSFTKMTTERTQLVVLFANGSNGVTENIFSFLIKSCVCKKNCESELNCEFSRSWTFFFSSDKSWWSSASLEIFRVDEDQHEREYFEERSF